MGTLFQCPLSGLLFDEDEVEFQVYEEVDHSEKQASEAATSAVMQGDCNILKRSLLLLLFLLS